MNKVIGLVTKPEKAKDQYKQDLLEIIDNFREMLETGEITEFVIASLDKDGEVVLTACCKDLIGGVGLFEFGKNALLNQ